MALNPMTDVLTRHTEDRPTGKGHVKTEVGSGVVWPQAQEC